ncbi:uncharacterized protein LOC105257371 isoform X2 [Camponotus floridanus]|uniref:uncharacterized protein LOC105257371 isoform X2 n=1 Tax=Camponotus floridanus TaxID=104421 RepID=UPI00059DA630|nr:uncharacterized protein LOC105257371 isoform X2 [Camponotus floridanus]
MSRCHSEKASATAASHANNVRYRSGCSPHFPGKKRATDMRFYFLSVLLLLVSLTCATQGSSLRTRRSVLNDIGNALNNIGQTIKDTMKIRIDSMFPHSTIEPETTEPILEPDWSGMTPESRQIITAPIRCPPNHVVVKKRCRMISRRR